MLPAALFDVLAEAQARGAVGPGGLQTYVEHALDFFGTGAGDRAARCIDLGSGGGLPGLPLAIAHPASEWVLLEARGARSHALDEALGRLGLRGRVTVAHERAEDAGRGPLRGWADVVTARSFGPPATTAECASPLLRVGGVLVVSEPLDAERWPPEGIAPLAMIEDESWRTPRGRFRSFRQAASCPDRFPRRPAAIARRPLF
jgi:16S rRNA (guanine527-N7)-methyltransferase